VGPDRGRHLRNVGILIVLALVVWLVPGGARAGATVSSLLGIAFAAGLLFFGYRIYMERRNAIHDLPDRHRGTLYASLALGTVAIVATPRMWQSGVGVVVWLALIGIAVAGAYSVWTAYRSSY
jgi:TRAP-type C4-dicarboxylate transport system permease small subunit